MTEQELKDKVESFVDGFDGLIDRNLVKSWLVHFAKTYAEAETKELEEDYAELKMIHDKFYESDAVQHKQILALNAEIKRLREFAQQCFKSPEKLAVIHYFENGEFDYCDLVPLQDAAINSLSPAPVAEDKFSASAYPKKCTPTIDQLTETDDMTMIQRLEKRIPPFHGVAPVTDGKDENGILPCECGNSRTIFNEAVGRLGAECYIQCRGCQRTTQLFKRETLSEARHLSIQDWNSPKNDNRK